jgi:ABC-type antimicrobial peptide transport system permease subunit
MQESPAPMIYRPMAQQYLPRMYVVARTFSPPSPDLFRQLQPALRAGRLEVIRIASLDQHLAESLVLDRFVTTLVTACGLMALALAIIGAYSLMLDSVQRRTREIGLRMALGASALRIARSIFGFGFLLTGIGVAVGLSVTLAAERAARMYVFGLPAVDAATMAITAGVLTMVVTLAAILPARRALRVSPTVALRL